MSDTTPSNAVLAEKIDSVSRVIDANQQLSHEAHNSILVQTTKTNGRVTALEKTKNMMLGALIFTNAILIPILIAYISKA